jgi:hypothetical protein
MDFYVELRHNIRGVKNSIKLSMLSRRRRDGSAASYSADEHTTDGGVVGSLGGGAHAESKKVVNK